MYHLLDLTGYLYRAVRESWRSTPPMNLLYSFTMLRPYTWTCSFFASSQRRTLSVGSTPTNVERSVTGLLSYHLLATTPTLSSTRWSVAPLPRFLSSLSKVNTNSYNDVNPSFSVVQYYPNDKCLEAKKVQID